MPPDVKRPYRSRRRAEQARATRQAIRTAAFELFARDGYATTPITKIAAHAGLAPQTVYSQFGTKAAIAKELLDVSIVGDDEPVPVAAREWFTRVLEPGIDGHERLRRYAHVVRRIVGGACESFEIVRRGADSDAALSDVWETNRRQRRAVVTNILTEALRDAELRPGLSFDRAVDLFFVLHGPELGYMLIVEMGWDLDAYERWLADALTEQLLAPAPLRP